MVLHSVHVPHCCMHFLSDNLKKVGFTNGIYSLSESRIFLSIYFLSILIMRHSSLGLCTELLVTDIWYCHWTEFHSVVIVEDVFVKCNKDRADMLWCSPGDDSLTWADSIVQIWCHTGIYQQQVIINNWNQHWPCTSNLRSTMICIIHSNNDSQRHRCQEEGLHHSDMHVFLDLPVNHHQCEILISRKNWMHHQSPSSTKGLFKCFLSFVLAWSSRSCCQQCTISHLATGHSSWLWEWSCVASARLCCHWVHMQMWKSCYPLVVFNNLAAIVSQ